MRTKAAIRSARASARIMRFVCLCLFVNMLTYSFIHSCIIDVLCLFYFILFYFVLGTGSIDLS